MTEGITKNQSLKSTDGKKGVVQQRRDLLLKRVPRPKEKQHHTPVTEVVRTKPAALNRESVTQQKKKGKKKKKEKKKKKKARGKRVENLSLLKEDLHKPPSRGSGKAR